MFSDSRVYTKLTRKLVRVWIQKNDFKKTANDTYIIKHQLT